MGWVRRGRFSLVAIIFQFVFIVLFARYVDYDYGADGIHDTSLDLEPSEEEASYVKLNGNFMAMFQDVHVMIFVGFGFLMTYMKRYGLSSVGFNMMVGAFVIQWATLVAGFLDMDEHNGRILINIETMINADFAAAAVLISFGAVLGRLSPLQMLIMSFMEIIIFQINEWIGLNKLMAVDVGGSMFVHVFGAYFGIAMGAVMAKNGDVEEQDHKAASVYHADLFSMIGTLFLWLFWPSFNGALADGNAQQRVVLNTYYALASCAVVTFAISALVDKEDKINMVHIQNATLAGGVAVGTSANMLIGPWGALTVGVAAGCLSVLGFVYLAPFIGQKLKLKDTCGVNNLHGMPGILAAFVSIIATTQASYQDYGISLYEIFPAMAPAENTTEYMNLASTYAVEPGLGRSPGTQALWQLVALVVTIGMGVTSGCITGLVLKLPFCNRPEGDELFEDGPWWQINAGQPDAEMGHQPDDYDMKKIIPNEQGPSYGTMSD